MTYQSIFREPFTAVPNIYFDHIAPLLTGTQVMVCNVVIRETIGWHRESAVISNAVFIAKTGRSEPAIIRAKKSLEEMGVLVVLQEGGGSQTGEYALDFHYDDPDRSIKASLFQEQELVEEDIPEAQDNITLDLPAVPADPQQEESEPQPEVDEVDNEAPLDLETDGSHGAAEPISDADIDDPRAETPDMADAENPVKTGDSATPNESLPPPSIEDINNIIYNKNKQKTDDADNATAAGGTDGHTADEMAKAERKRANAAVCSLLRSLGVELASKDYAFIGWCLKKYGVETVQQKIQIMKFQRSRGVKYSNPLGWLRNALAKDYAYTSWDSEVMKGKKRARRGKERREQERMERDRERQREEQLRSEAGTMKAQLAPDDREELRKAAIDQILSMEGMPRNLIGEPLIQSVENRILRAGVAG